jgi:hypothetical protein
VSALFHVIRYKTVLKLLSRRLCTVKKKKYPEGEKSFSFTNEHIVRAIRWGQNRFIIRCGNDVKTIELYQKK